MVDLQGTKKDEVFYLTDLAIHSSVGEFGGTNRRAKVLPSSSRLMFVIRSASHWDLLNSSCDPSMNMFRDTSAPIVPLLNFPTAYSKHSV